MKKSLILSKLTYLVVFFFISNLPIDAQVTVDENKNVLVGDGSPTSGYKFTVNGNTDIIGLIRSKEFYAVNSNGTISLREKTLPNTTFTYQELHIRPSFGKSGLITFTEDAVADRWTIGTLSNSSKFIFSQGNPTSINDNFIIDRVGSKTSIALDNNLTISGDRTIKFGDGSGNTNFKILNNLSQDIFTVIDNRRVHIDGKFGINSFNNFASNFTVGGHFRLHSTQSDNDLGQSVEGGLVVAFQTPPNQNPSTRFFFGNGSGYQMHFSKRVSNGTTDLMTIADDGTIVAGLLKIRPGGKVGINYNFNPIVSNFNVYGHFRLGGTQDDADIGQTVEAEMLIANKDYDKRIFFGDGSGYKINFSKRTNSTTTDILTLADNGTLTSGKFKIYTNGNIGINYPNSPTAALSILGQTRTAEDINQQFPDATGSEMITTVQNGNKNFYIGDRTGYKFKLISRVNATNYELMTVSDTGLVKVVENDVYINNSSKGIILKSLNGNCFRVTVDDSGNLIRTQTTCPN